MSRPESEPDITAKCRGIRGGHRHLGAEPTLTPETYLGTTKQVNCGGSQPYSAKTTHFTLPKSRPKNTFALDGSWILRHAACGTRRRRRRHPALVHSPSGADGAGGSGHRDGA
ncbi:hypothetical protein [Humibacter antri]